MMQHYIKEVEQEPFDHEEFIERLAWKTIDVFKEDEVNNFDPNLLYELFVQAIKDLEVLLVRQQKKCNNLETICQEEENNHWQKADQFQKKNNEIITLFQDLDEQINVVAAKVIHLGDQLENINIPRSRAVEAQKLMFYFTEFLTPGPVLSEVFTDKEELFEAANIIQKLHMIVQELPGAKFEEARKNINAKYDEIERSLIEELVKAQRIGDRVRMKDIAAILSHYKSYSQCIDAFIEECQNVTINNKDIFRDILPLTEKNFNLAKDVFNSPEQVMEKFVLNIYHLKLQNYIGSILTKSSDNDKYLINLMELYTRTLQLSKDFGSINMGIDDSYLRKLTHTIFQKYLDTYISKEMDSLKDKCTNLLQQYYDNKGHQKRQLQSGFQDFKKLQMMANRAISSIVQLEDMNDGETFLSEEVAVCILQESKAAFSRCQILSNPMELSNNVFRLLEVVLNCLIVEYVDYAVELGLESIPNPENKSQHLYFLDTVRQANIIVHLTEKHFTNSVLPLIVSTPKYGECIMKKNYLFSCLEQKLNDGIDKIINTMVGWIRICLQNDQKKTDFLPDTDADILQSTLISQVCLKVVQYVNDNLAHIKQCLDGRNLEYVSVEFGCRFHRVLFEHLQTFQYNSTGAIRVICDLNEYRKCVKELKSQLVDKLFDTLHSLCNLLLVKPENLIQVCNEDNLAPLDEPVLHNFIQLRSDYKTERLANLLKGLT